MTVALVLIVCAIIIFKILQLLTKARCKSPVCLVGKTALITGGNSGIGFETALGLAARGCRVIIADKDDSEDSKRKIIERTGNPNVIVKKFNLASLKSVRALAEDINRTEERLDILINNAGAGGLGNALTEDGLHIGMQVNHFGPFLLTHLLVDLLKKSAPSRIIFTSSIGAFCASLTVDNLNPKFVPGMAAYYNSKLCNVITANELSKKLSGTGVTANSLHPGIVHTPIYRKALEKNNMLLLAAYHILLYPFSKNAEEGAQTILCLAMSKKLEKVTGKYFIDGQPFIKPFGARSESFSNKIWEKSEELVKLSPKEKL